MGKSILDGRSKSLIAKQQSIQSLHSLIASTLEQHGITENHIEADIIIMDTLAINRVELISSQDSIVSADQLHSIESIITRRIHREPLAYILGYQPFYGLDFAVNSNVLIPRPETELLVEEILNTTISYNNLSVADIGTGSGVIAITLAIMRGNYKFYAVDQSAAAVELAKQNAKAHNVLGKIDFKTGHLFANTKDKFDVIVSNLPYIPSSRLEQLDPELSWEPPQALDGGTDGSEVISKLIYESVLHVKPDSTIFLEIDHSHSDKLINIANKVFPTSSIQIKQDLQGFDRILIINPFGRNLT